MGVLITTSGGPEGLLRNYWKNRLLGILKNNLMAGDLMDTQVIPANAGNVIEFHRINGFPKQMDGVTETMAWLHPGTATMGALKGRTFNVDSVVYGLELLTNDLHMSEKSIMCAEPNPIPELTERFLYNAKDTLDQRYINMMVSSMSGAVGASQDSTLPVCEYFGSSVSVTATWGDGSQTLTEATLDADNPSHRIAAESFNTIYTGLRSRSAKPRSGNAFDTLIAPELAGDLRTDATFQDIALKGHGKGEDKFETASMGEVFGCRIIEDENVSVPIAGTIDATNDVIIRCPTVGQGAFARISHAKGVGVPRVNYIPPGKVDKADPYGLIGLLTWKVYTANGGLLNPLAANVLKCVTTRAKSTTQSDDGNWNNG